MTRSLIARAAQSGALTGYNNPARKGVDEFPTIYFWDQVKAVWADEAVYRPA